MQCRSRQAFDDDDEADRVHYEGKAHAKLDVVQGFEALAFSRGTTWGKKRLVFIWGWHFYSCHPSCKTTGIVDANIW